ncbi:MAG TPA: iron uptake transporter deferrochelatase/peroxidase subunit [Steroidobacteraceae bacterium]|nr:iron uptake transporter deferrochelatase/peroxidase subunit [Steroidobacteraceae bacterium]
MSTHDDKRRRERRAFLTRATGLAAVAAGGAAIGPRAAASRSTERDIEPFWGVHQAGIATPLQKQLYFATFDVTTTRREELVSLLRAWTDAAARMTVGDTAQPLDASLQTVGTAESINRAAAAYGASTKVDAGAPAADSGEALGLSPARLTVTFGFGASLFIRNGQDRYGLAARRPEALVDLPKFPGDQLIAEHTDGDLAVQACADDPQVAFHAVRQLARLAANVAKIRWAQTGFMPDSHPGETPRNLMGFKDGTDNPSISDPAAMARVVWVGSEGPDWMRGGSYLVARRIRIALEHWDRMKVAFQEQTVGRRKYSGAPLGQKGEFDPLNLDAVDTDGNSLTPESSHVRLAAAASNNGARILRRPYSYNEGVNPTTERWPPWHQGLEFDAGLFFIAYQRDPRTGFIKIQDRLSRFDMMNQFVTHVGGGLFACPGGMKHGGFIGQHLFEAT